MYVCKSVCLSVRPSVCLSVCVYVYVYIYMYVYIYVYIYMYIYIYMSVARRFSNKRGRHSYTSRFVHGGLFHPFAMARPASQCSCHRTPMAEAAIGQRNS
jgi:hypothetical protein